ncbi:MAG: 4Fe-4S dicluster domain-containing protein [Candidatus Abyssobacteria bacterium SURF_17]|uniref:4Fe-4S dicluster domain-containing protein n=1 Tax=Candidatus Abyssobacteria bacterium SURF_17 TaxID=2093361 RepID=A0A419F086_9BACT|nr:MAG: 4Fe-4S dicluster domain-containing protein [Candidatus Abyssubacteria bacterium SURF_17]
MPNCGTDSEKEIDEMSLDKKYLDLFRPKIHWGKIEIDVEKCTGCGQCTENCPGKVPALNDEGKAYMGREECITCSNCAVTCPTEAITIKETFFVEEGYFKTIPADIPYKYPAPPLDANGKPSEYTSMEKAVLERRSVRNFKDTPVPEPLIRRILEAGRHAPSTGNCQPWRFIVITDKALMEEIGARIQPMALMVSTMYRTDEMLEMLAAQYETDPQPGMFDPRVQGGVYCVGQGILPPLVNAPALIVLLGDERAISNPEINIGICGTNMTLVANSLGLGACWVGFITLVNMMPDVMERLGIEAPYKVIASLAVGYPAFKQHGMVAREAKPVTWFRPGADGPEIEQ